MIGFLFGYIVASSSAPTEAALHEFGMVIISGIGFAVFAMASLAFWHWATGPHAPEYTNDPGPQ